MTTPPKSRITYQSEPTDDDGEAEARFKETCSNDPFPDIYPALLNSSDIADYVRQTGMVCPFSAESLKSASCAVRLGAKVIYWKEDQADTDPVELYLDDGEEFKINPNSIVFVNTEEYFRIPDYIAIRFNLHIEFVHRGLLLGTGPLVDPGFQGRLLIPLHNLTTNAYSIRRGEEIIWVEFTKVSPNTKWETTSNHLRYNYNLTGEYVPFKPEKKDQEPWDYLKKAMTKRKNGRFAYPTIRSSLPAAVEITREFAREAQTNANDARADANAAKKEVERISRRLYGFGWAAAVVGLVTIGTMIFGGYAVVNGAIDVVQSARQEVTEAGNHRASVYKSVENANEKISSLGAKMRKESGVLKDQLDNIKQQMQEITQ